MKVRDLVERKNETVVTVDATAPLGTAVRLMMENRVGGLPVLNEQRRLVGFVNERDIVEMLPAYAGDVRDLPVSKAMQQPSVCTLDDPLSVAMTRMTQERVRHLVASDGDRVAGILSLGDIVKHRMEELELEAGVLRDYVAAQRAAS